MFVWLIATLGLSVILLIVRSAINAISLSKEHQKVHFFLSNRLFISLVVLINFWLILLLLLGAQTLPDDERQIVVILASLFAPFLSWWRQKRQGENY